MKPLKYGNSSQANSHDEDPPFQPNLLCEGYRAVSSLKHIVRDFATICCKFQLLQQKQVIKITLTVPFPPRERWWMRRSDIDEKIALQYAKSQIKALFQAREEQWKKLLDLCGETIRPGAKAGKTNRTQVVSRSYRTQPAARRIGLPEKALLAAIEQGIVPAFRDPGDRLRISASTVDAFAMHEELYEKIAGFIILKTRDLAVACGVHRSSMYRRLQKLGVSTTRATWGEVGGRWELPATYALYQKVLNDNW